MWCLNDTPRALLLPLGSLSNKYVNYSIYQFYYNFVKIHIPTFPVKMSCIFQLRRQNKIPEFGSILENVVLIKFLIIKVPKMTTCYRAWDLLVSRSSASAKNKFSLSSLSICSILSIKQRITCSSYTMTYALLAVLIRSVWFIFLSPTA